MHRCESSIGECLVLETTIEMIYRSCIDSQCIVRGHVSKVNRSRLKFTSYNWFGLIIIMIFYSAIALFAQSAYGAYEKDGCGEYHNTILINTHGI